MIKKIFDILKGNNILPFLFFVLVSCCLWLLQVLNEDYEADIPFSVSILNVPDNLELVDEDNLEVMIRLSDKGRVLAGYTLDKNAGLVVDFAEFKHRGGTLSLPVSSLKKQVSAIVAGTTSVVQYHDDTLYVKVKQNQKLLPVRLNGKIDAADHYEITAINIEPYDVMVSAMPDKLELMDFVETEYVVKRYLKNDKSYAVRIATDDYMNVEPAVVNVHVSVSPLKVKKVRVPLAQVNFPRPMYAMWLPNEVELSFEVSEANYDLIGPSDFTVNVDYNEIITGVGGYVPIHLVNKTPLVKNIQLTPSRIFVSAPL